MQKKMEFFIFASEDILIVPSESSCRNKPQINGIWNNYFNSLFHETMVFGK